MAAAGKIRNLIIPGILILLGLLIVLTPWYIFPICEIAEKSGSMQMGTSGNNAMNMNMDNGTHMTCWYTAEAEAGTGALVVLIGLVLFVLQLTGRRIADNFVAVIMVIATAHAFGEDNVEGFVTMILRGAPGIILTIVGIFLFSDYVGGGRTVRTIAPPVRRFAPTNAAPTRSAGA